MTAAMRAAMSIRKLKMMLALALAAGMIACGSDAQSGTGTGTDLSIPTDGLTSGIGHDMTNPIDGKVCTTNADCPSGCTNPSCASDQFLCNFAVADGCGAIGHCRPVHVPTCASITYACGCDGKRVDDSACFYDSGFAGGPILPGSHYPADCTVDGGP
jgi:hypothetical protein